VTEVVVTVNVTLELPAVIVTDAGTDACTLSDESVITVPPAGAGPTIVTAHVVGEPPETDVAVKDKPDRLSGLIQYRSSVDVSNCTAISSITAGSASTETNKAANLIY
jgi:hypothetical protein